MDKDVLSFAEEVEMFSEAAPLLLQMVLLGERKRLRGVGVGGRGPHARGQGALDAENNNGISIVWRLWLPFGSEMLCKEHKWLNNNTVVSPKRAHYGLSAHIPMFCFDFLLRSKTYSKERPPSASIANRGFPLSMKTEHVVRLVYIHNKVLLLSGLH